MSLGVRAGGFETLGPVVYNFAAKFNPDEPRLPEPSPQETAMQDDPTELILLLLREGSIEHAVELYCEVTGASREQAKRHIDQLARRAGLKSVRHRWRTLALLAGGALIVSLLLL